MLKVPAWIIEKLIKAGKLAPSDAWWQMNADDLLHLIKELVL